jgi:hypothetical protein
MPCNLRHYELDEITEGTLVAPVPTRMQRLKNLVCGGPWGGNDAVVLVYWKTDSSAPNGGLWVAWVDKPAPKVDPLPEAAVSIL